MKFDLLAGFSVGAIVLIQKFMWINIMKLGNEQAPCDR